MQIDGRSAILGALLAACVMLSIGQSVSLPASSPDYSPWVGGEKPAFVSQSADGKTLYFWGNTLAPVVVDPATKIKIMSSTADDLGMVSPAAEAVQATAYWTQWEAANPGIPGRKIWDEEVADFYKAGLRGDALSKAAERAWNDKVQELQHGGGSK